MDFLDYIRVFLGTETPFMLLFVALFFYTVKTNKDREERQSHLIDQKLDKISEESQVLLKVWKILLEKELEERK